ANPRFRTGHARDDRRKSEHFPRLLAGDQEILRAQAKRNPNPFALCGGPSALAAQRDAREPLQLAQQLERLVAQRLEALSCAHAVNRRARLEPSRSACPSTRA